MAWSYEDDSGVGDPKGFQLACLASRCCESRVTWTPRSTTPTSGPLRRCRPRCVAACRETEELNATIARELRDAPVIYVIGAGPNHGIAYCLAMCYLQEMQWKDAASFDAAEFLHGAMEVVTEDTAVIQYLGEEATRPIDERAKAFLERYHDAGRSSWTRVT